MSFESSITQSIITYIKSIGGQAEKVKGDASASGRPDINACYKGRCLRIEVKTPDNKNTASKKQQINLKRWRYAGAVCMSVYSKQAVKYFIELLDSPPRIKYRLSQYEVYSEENKCVSECYIPIYLG